MILRNQGRFKRDVITTKGVLTIRRTMLAVPRGDEKSRAALAEIQGTRKGVFPLDELLGIDRLPLKMTPAMMCAVAREAVRAQSYRDAEALVAQHYRVTICSRTIRKVTELVGSLVAEDDRKRGAEAREAMEAGFDRRTRRRRADDVLYIEMDGAMVATRGDGGGVRWRECKIGMAFARADMREWTTRKGEVRREITTKRFVGLIGGYREFGELLLGMVHHCYDHRRRHRIVVVTDGAEWIRTLVRDLFPGATHILDLAHAKEHVSAFSRLIGLSEDERAEWVGLVNRDIEEGRVEDALDRIRPYRDAEIPADETNLYDYVESRTEMMRYADFRAAGDFVGSGACESANKYVMQDRMKLTGMSWGLVGGQAVLALKCRYEADCWDEVVALVEAAYGVAIIE